MLGWIAGAAVAILATLGFYYDVANEDFWGIFGGVIVGIISGALVVLLFYFVWSTWKVAINISRNLFIINDKLDKIVSRQIKSE